MVSIFTRIEEQNRSLEECNSNLNSQSADLTKQVQDLNTKMASIFTRVEEQNRSLKECNSNLNSQSADLTKQVQDLNNKVSEQKRLTEASNKDLMTLLERQQEEQQKRLENQGKEQGAQVADLVQQMQDLRSKMSSIYEEMGKHKQLTETFNNNLTNLMEKQKERERLEKDYKYWLEVAKKQEVAKNQEVVNNMVAAAESWQKFGIPNSLSSLRKSNSLSRFGKPNS
ncbi:hypothetical protein H8356DRAFT_483695 [Neocallimastix lanati (nom. inval.)]|nr:hypothetical protein H8356DRAFT_483695 [Neocallimastix sp. JGI-2020a]